MFTKNNRKNFYIFLIFSFAAVALFIVIYLINIHNINQKYYEIYNTDSQIALRKFPYPYRAAMTISSDIDRTETLEEFLEIQKFLNTKELTKMGKGIDLGIGNSFFFYEPSSDAISYYQSESNVPQTIRQLIHSEFIDTIHSFGKKEDFNRENAILALKELNKYNCKVDVWVDHSKTKDNLGDDVTIGFGDHPASKEYHADLTLAYGIKFVWLGRVTMITGQSVPFSLRAFTNIFDSDHPFNSFLNISKELAKNVFAVFGNKKYAMHKVNDLLNIAELNDGQKVYEFIRFDNFYQGVSTGANSKRLAYVISKKTLNNLKNIGGYMIDTHLGMNSDCSQYICKETQDALRNLAAEYRSGNIFIATTSKLLNYYINHKYLNWTYDFKDGEIIIHIHNIKDPIAGNFMPTLRNLEGMTFYVPDKQKAKIYLNNIRVTKVKANPADYTQRESLTITTE